MTDDGTGHWVAIPEPPRRDQPPSQSYWKDQQQLTAPKRVSSLGMTQCHTSSWSQGRDNAGIYPSAFFPPFGTTPGSADALVASGLRSAGQLPPSPPQPCRPLPSKSTPYRPGTQKSASRISSENGLCPSEAALLGWLPTQSMARTSFWGAQRGRRQPPPLGDHYIVGWLVLTAGVRREDQD